MKKKRLKNPENDTDQLNPRYSYQRDNQGRFATIHSEPLAQKVIGIRLPESLHERVYKRSDRTKWLRKVIAEADAREKVEQEGEEDKERSLTL